MPGFPHTDPSSHVILGAILFTLKLWSPWCLPASISSTSLSQGPRTSISNCLKICIFLPGYSSVNSNTLCLGSKIIFSSLFFSPRISIPGNITIHSPRNLGAVTSSSASLWDENKIYIPSSPIYAHYFSSAPHFFACPIAVVTGAINFMPVFTTWFFF